MADILMEDVFHERVDKLEQKLETSLADIESKFAHRFEQLEHHYDSVEYKIDMMASDIKAAATMFVSLPCHLFCLY